MERQDLGDGGWISLTEGFVEEHEALLEALAAELPLRQETVHIFGKTHLTPRLTSWHGDPGCAYAYSGRRFEPEPWTARLAALRDAVRLAGGAPFNSVLTNLYRDGSDAMGAHADDERELGPSRDDVRIASVSLGARRRFVLRKRNGQDKVELSLGEGSLLVMGGTLQQGWVHHVPRTKRPVGVRLNLTFRVVRL